MYVRPRPTRAGWAAAAGLTLALLLSACGGIEVSAGTDDLSADDVASKAAEALTPKVGSEPTVTCDDGLTAEEGESTTCSMQVGGDPKEYAVEATVSSVDGDDVSLDFRSDDYRPTDGKGTIFADEVARQAADALEKQYGTRPKITCPDDLPGKAGATTRCVLGVEGDDTEYGMTAEVSEMDGTRYHLDFTVDDEPLDETS
ncbi:DUF4333 domain-containing protein [Solicola gregarius]|uniref:DUF4333 domain-containing protein n=1 Tax=Solicola gregarius TaxID=2908642 RepID=A0AA46TJK7_9ACTN|nr:DUF4333 domain-containing protein [Solicola gregarius]UYM06456.1 DUF4333 domain-containing protein [Solicola gregarius]